MGGNITNFLLDLKTIKDENFASYGGSIEVGEFILSSAAILKYESHFDEINLDLTPNEPIEQITITKNSRVINTFGDGAYYLLVDSAFAVVNKYATAKKISGLGIDERTSILTLLLMTAKPSNSRN